MILRLLFASTAVLLAGCFNDYTNYYRPYVATAEGTTAGQLAPFSGRARLIQSDNPEAESQTLVRQGYVQLGESFFNDTSSRELYYLEEHALKVGADVVLYSDNYLGTEQRMQRDEYHYGRREDGEPRRVEVVYTPYQVNHYSHWASFWRMGALPIFGAIYDDLPDHLRQSLQRNTGVVVKGVIDRSPAFYANILVGDVIVEMNGMPVLSSADMEAQVRTLAGRYVQVALIRAGKEMMITVPFNKDVTMMNTALPPAK